MKILHICITDSRGGAGIASYRLHTLMNENSLINSEMLVLIKNTADDNIYQLSEFQFNYARLGNLFNTIFGKWQKKPGLLSLGILGNNLYKHPKVIDCDIIYLHWVNNGMLGINKLEKIFELRKQIFLFNHDMWYFTGVCHQSNGCQLYNHACSDCHFFDTKFSKRIVNNRFKQKRKIYEKFPDLNFIAPSKEFYKKVFESNVISNKKNIYYIPNVLDITKFKPRENNNKLGKHKKRILFGAIGGPNNTYKGWEDFLYIINGLSEEELEKIEVFLFGFDFSKDEMNKLPFIKKSYGLIFSEEEMINIYQNADVFIFPSLQESFGQTLFEAMSCGVLPIAYNVGAANDLILDGYNGFIREVSEKNNLLLALKKVIQMNDLNGFKENARNFIVEKFSHKKIIDMHLDIINQTSVKY